MKALHITHHEGCAREIEYVASKLGFEVETWFFEGGYNISEEIAAKAWEENRKRIKTADVVLTSDTAPLSRIILQHIDIFAGRLVVWVCNRFDYHDAATNDCGFPDSKYYALFREGAGHPRVRMVAYTEFEHEYARRLYEIEMGRRCIKPTGKWLPYRYTSQIPDEINVRNTFFIPPYHNDTHMLDLQRKCESLGISVWRGKYAGPRDLAKFRGVIHIPYTWSTFAFFENMQAGLPQFIPSLKFLHELRQQHGDFFWSPPFMEDVLPLAEEYWSMHSTFVVYFDSWEDLQRKTTAINVDVIRKRSKAYGAWHEQEMLNRWKQVLNI